MSLVQTPPPTIPDTFAIAATAVAIDVPTPLAQSMVYTHYIPVIVVCLAVCYTSIYIMRCIYWHYRRRRKRQLWFERGRLRLFWLHVTARQQERQQQQQQEQHEQLEEKLLTEDDDLPITTHDISSYALQLPRRPATFPNHTNNLSNISLFSPSSSLSSSYSYILDRSRALPPSSLLSPTMSSSLPSSNNTVSATILPRPHSVIGITPMSGCYYDSSTTLAELSLSTSRSVSQRQQPKERVKQRRDSNNSNTSTTSTLISTSKNTMTKRWRYWTQNKKKRRKLIWQWSVAMGYCQYTHANRIDYLVHQLQQQRYQQQHQGEKQFIEQDITDQDEKKALGTSSSLLSSSYSLSSSSSSYHHNLIM